MTLWNMPTRRRRRWPASTRSRSRGPTLRFTPYGWAKLLYLRDCGDTEVGGFGITAAQDLLLVEDICLLPQECGLASVVFSDAAVADYFDLQVDRDLPPERFGRIWIHTHPGDSPSPSSTDEATFARAFGAADWAVMFILARGGRSYARLRFGVGPGAEMLLAVAVDFQAPFPPPDQLAWHGEYERCVKVPDEWRLPRGRTFQPEQPRSGWEGDALSAPLPSPF